MSLEAQGTERAARPRWRRAAILGTGLIGGSVAAALRERGLAAQIVGCSPGADGPRAMELGLIDCCEADAAHAVVGADLVVIAAPIPVIPGLLSLIREHLSPDALVTDCASTKRSTIEAARQALGASFARFVPGHPIAGGEGHGPDAARATLFERCVAVLCPQDDTDPAYAAHASGLWAELGARVVTMGAEEHDRLFAEVSHWPHAVAFALCGAIASGQRAEPARQFAGAGLRDTTRIGASSADLWADILIDNREAALDCARAFEREMSRITQALQDGDRDRLRACFEAASAWRRGLG